MLKQKDDPADVKWNLTAVFSTRMLAMADDISFLKWLSARVIFDGSTCSKYLC